MAKNETVITTSTGQVLTQEDIDKAAKILEQQKNQRAKQQERVKNNPEAKAKADLRAKRLRVKNTLLIHKAVAAGITVSDQEIDDYIAANPTREA